MPLRTIGCACAGNCCAFKLYFMSYQGRKDIEMINLGAYLHNPAVLHFNKLFLLYHNVDSVARLSPEVVVKFDSLTAYEIQL